VKSAKIYVALCYSWVVKNKVFVKVLVGVLSYVL